MTAKLALNFVKSHRLTPFYLIVIISANSLKPFNKLPDMSLKLLGPMFLKKLEVLHMSSRRASLMSRQGDLRIGKHGAGIEFMEYKEYCLGDDFKQIDWNIYGRLDRLYVKLFHAERSLSVYIFLDASKSMLLPRKDKKFEYALRAALALSYVALIGQHRVKLFLLGGESKSKTRGIIQETIFFEGKHRILEIGTFLERVHPGGIADLGASANKAIYKTRDVGTAIIISDFLMEIPKYKRDLSYLRFKNFDINAIHVLGYNEQNPLDKVGKVKLRDIETNEERIVHLNDINLKKYKQAIIKHQQQIKDLCLANKAVYTLASTEIPVEDFILKELPRMGLLR